MSKLQSAVPAIRVRALNDQPVRDNAAFVLYWSTAYRRVESNFALQRAADWAYHLGLPLVVLSALRLDYQYASDRLHAFILDGIADLDRQYASTNAVHFAYVESAPGQGKGLLAALAADAAVVVADDAPVFFLPAMTAAAAGRVPVLMEGVDHNGILPVRATDRVFLRAYDLRRYLQHNLPAHLDDRPAGNVLRRLPVAAEGLLEELRVRWPSLPPSRDIVKDLPLDHSVAPTPLVGGPTAGSQLLVAFVADRLDRYPDRNHPDEEASSGLSPYLHFGNVSPHQVFDAVVVSEGWTPGLIGDKADGSREGWWGMSSAAEAFLDQLITWRELGYRAAALVPDNDRFEALPGWAQQTLAEHESDPREYIYTLEQLDDAATHDEIWNAAQRELRTDGVIHNYLRMLWGKKILEWTRSPREAHDIMFALNDRYALDGRDPNSVSGIHWVLGRYDRPWGPERSIFGKVRYMSSDATRRKVRLKRYLSAGQDELFAT
jgi:deoxyribodipyrimidine photo-lyase